MYSFTQEDLLQYLYQETSAAQTLAIKDALLTDWNLREEYNALVESVGKLEKVQLSPRKSTIDSILNYAEKSLEELSSHA